MKWVKSTGGPLVCLERPFIVQWRGTSGYSGSGVVGVNQHSDYDRACAEKDYLGLVQVDGGTALILGEMPLVTSVCALRGFVTIVRLFYADAQSDFQRLLSRIDDRTFLQPAESLSFTSVSGHLVMFDAAYAGGEEGDDRVEFEIGLGAFQVLTALAEPDERTSLLLHRFFPVS